MKFKYLVLTSMLAITPTAFASLCTDVINEIHDNVGDDTRLNSNEVFAWMKLDWVVKQLGEPAVDKSQPQQTDYYWRCSADSEMDLTLSTDANGTLIRAKGQYNSSEGSGIFSVALNEANFTTPAAPTPPPTTMNAAPADTLNPNPIISYQQYYNNLRQCKPGNYQYSMTMMNTEVHPKSTIFGEQLNKCIVETSYDTPTNEKMLIKCQFKPQSLELFTDEAAAEAARGNIGYNRKHPTAMQKVMKNECQAFLDGQELKHL